MSDYTLKQSGEKETFPGGAQRDTQKGKPRYDLIPPLALKRVADLYTKGAEHYGDRNWEKGMPFSRFFGSLLRHAYQFSMGEKDEDHLAAIVFNALAIMHFQEFHHPKPEKRIPTVPGKPYREPAWVKAKCPRCGQIVVTLGGLTRDICLNCSHAFDPKENLEKPLTSEPPPAKIDERTRCHPACVCDECFADAFLRWHGA